MNDQTKCSNCGADCKKKLESETEKEVTDDVLPTECPSCHYKTCICGE